MISRPSLRFSRLARISLFLVGLPLAALSSLRAAVPADEDFSGYGFDGGTVATPRTLGGFVYEANGGATTYLSDKTTFGLTVGTGTLIIINADDTTSGSYVEIHSSNLSDKFKLVSLAIESFTSGWSDTFTITGYNGGSGTSAVASDTINLASSDSSGSITYTKNPSAVGGVLTFDSTWQNIDTIRFTITSGSGPKFSIDDIDISAAVVPNPTISSATYNASTGVLVVTGANMTVGDTIDVSKLSIRGDGGNSYTLTSPNVTASSSTTFTVTLNATDKAAVNPLLNRNGTTSTDISTYILDAADDWDSNVTSGDTSDTNNVITVSNVPVPTITSATYDASSGTLNVTGTGLLKLTGSPDIVVNKLTLTGEGGSAYPLTTTGVEITNNTSFSVTLNGADKAAVNQILNKNGTASTSGTTYNLAAAEDWNAGADSAVVIADTTGNGVTVSNVAVPAITSATYNASTGALVVTGTDFFKLNGATNDIVANKFTLTGEGGATYTLTDTSNAEITSGTSFTVTLSSNDKSAVNQLFNKNGTSSTGGTTYNLAAAEDWAAGADAAVVIADATGNGITVSNVAVPTITSATYDGATGALVVTGANFLPLNGATNDIVANKFIVTGEGGATYTLTDTANVEITSGTSFTLTLSATDKAALTSIINKNGTASNGGTTYNLAAAEDWAAGADAATVTADLTGNGITASNADLIPPTVASVNVPANATYISGQNLDFTVNFSENVIVTGTPSIALTIGSTGRSAGYISGSGTSALVFRYTVQTSDLDTDGVAVGALALNGGAIQDAANNNATLTLNSVGSTAAVLVDAVAPTVSSATVPANATYIAAQNLDFTVTYSENVTVNTGGGTPYIGVTLDTGGSVQAAYLSGSGTTTLTFRYTVASGNLDANGITVASSLTLNGGTIKDSAGNNAQTTSLGFGSTASVLVDGVAPSVSSISRVSSSLTNATSVDYTVTFSENVSGVDTSDFSVTATGTASGSIASVNAVNGSTYTVTVNTISGDGTLRLDLNNSGTGIADTPGNAIGAGYTSGQNYTIDNTAPTVSSVSVPTNATYTSGQNLDFTVNFSESVTVNTGGGTPRIALTIGSTTQYALYLSGSGTSALVFRYTIQSGDLDADGITVGALGLNGGTLRDAASNNATLTLNSVGSTSSVLVDAVAPGISSSTVPANATYAAGQNLDFTVTYSEAVTVNTGGGTPYIGITLDTGGSVQAAYISGSGTTTLTFRYTVTSGNLDTDGVTVASSITLNGGTIKDSNSNNAATTSLGFASTAAVLVDGVAPTVSSINRQTPSGASTNATSVTYRVTFAESVSGVDSSDFTLTATSTAAGTIASVSAVSGSVYDVVVNSISGGGTLRLDLKASGTGIADTPGNAIATGFTSGQTYTIDGTAPTASSIVRQTPTTVTTSATSLTWRMTFSEDVTGVDSTDFTLTTVSGNGSGTVGTVTPVSASVYDIAVTSVAGFGTLRLDLKSSGTGIADLAGNAVSGGFATGDVYFVGPANVFDTVSLATGTTRSVSNATTSKVAQRFTTSASAPLTFTNVTAALGAVTGSPTPVVTINTDVSGTPGTVVATLTNPSSLTASTLNTWTSSTLLSASTTYWIVFADTSGAGAYEIQETAVTTGGVGSWLTGSDYVYFYGVNAGTGPQAGALRIAIGATSTPTVTSTLVASGTYGSAFNYSITATNSPTGYGATGLPTGLTLNSATGAITGAPTQAGTFNVALTGTNGSGTGAPSTLVLTVAKAPLTVTAVSTSRTVSTSNPAFSVSYSGFVNSDTASSLTTAPTATTTATLSSPVGTYPITASGGVSSNYSFTYVDGVLTVVASSGGGGGGGGGGGVIVTPPTSVTIALGGLTATYDGTAKTVSATTTPAGFTPTITYNGSTTAPTNAGTYAVVATVNTSTATGSATGTLTISPAAQTITFTALADRETNSAPFALSATASSGLPVSFTLNSGPVVLSGGIVTLTGTPGAVTITASQSGNANYLAAPAVSRSFTVIVAGPRIFIGDVVSNGGGKLGDIGAVLPPTGSVGHLVIIAASINIDLALDFTLQPDSTFVRLITTNSDLTSQSVPGMPPVAAAARTLTLRGQLVGNMLSGRCDEAAFNFTVPVQSRGTTTNVAGFYQASTINNADGTTSALVGNNGEVIVLATAGSTVAGGRTTLNANGTFTLTAGTATVRGTVDATSTSVTGVISQPGTSDVSFAGVATSTARTDRLINLSSRSRVGPSADRTLITGFVIGGTQPKRVLLRAVGPTLAGFGVTGSLSNPKLQVYDNSGHLMMENDDWSGADTAAAFVQTGAFNLPNGARDAAVVTTLAPGAYTVHVISTGETGTALAEIYDASATPQTDSQRLVNISSRGMVEASDGVLIGGFVVTGNSPKRMLIRGIGPTLATLGVTGALVDPKLTIYSGQTKIAENDNWGTPIAVGANQAVATADDIAAAARATGAFGLANGTKDAAVVITLSPGAYTAQVSSTTGLSGTALVEIYEIPE